MTEYILMPASISISTSYLSLTLGWLYIFLLFVIFSLHFSNFFHPIRLSEPPRMQISSPAVIKSYTAPTFVVSCPQPVCSWLPYLHVYFGTYSECAPPVTFGADPQPPLARFTIHEYLFLYFFFIFKSQP